MKKSWFLLIALAVAIASCAPEIEDGGNGGGDGSGTGTGGSGSGGDNENPVVYPGGEDYLPGYGNRKSPPSLKLGPVSEISFEVVLANVDQEFNQVYVQVRIGKEWKYYVPGERQAMDYAVAVPLAVGNKLQLSAYELPKGQVDIRVRTLHQDFPGKPDHVGNYNNALASSWSELFTVEKANLNGYGDEQSGGDHEVQKECELTLYLPELNLFLYSYYEVFVSDGGKPLVSNYQTTQMQNVLKFYLTEREEGDNELLVEVHRYRLHTNELSGKVSEERTLRLDDDVIRLNFSFKEADFK